MYIILYINNLVILVNETEIIYTFFLCIWRQLILKLDVYNKYNTIYFLNLNIFSFYFFIIYKCMLLWYWRWKPIIFYVYFTFYTHISSLFLPKTRKCTYKILKVLVCTSLLFSVSRNRVIDLFTIRTFLSFALIFIIVFYILYIKLLYIFISYFTFMYKY